MSDVTLLLTGIERGDPVAADQLLPLVYDELRKLAACKMEAERPGHSLQATDLVHEAFVRLVDVRQIQHWKTRGHFFAAAAAAMRRILVENARRKQRVRHGGGRQRAAVDACDIAAPEPNADLLALDAALDKLKLRDGTAADLVQLRYFAGLTLPEAAEMLDLSPRSADRTWAFAKAWLHRELS